MNRLRFLPALLLAAPLFLSACDSINNDDDPIRRAFVTRVIIEQFPLVNTAEGNGWDGGDITSTDEADLYFRILGSNDVELLNGESSDLVTADGQAGSRVFRNAGTADLPVTFTVNEFLIDALDRALVVQIKDDDSDVLNPDDDIERSDVFRLEDHIPSPLPNDRTVSIPIESVDGTFRGRVTVRYSS